MRIKQLAYAIGMIGFVGSIGFAGAADEVQKAEKIEVTGSSIKRVQKEGAAAVVSVGKEEIQKIGAATTGELLRSLPSVGADDDSGFSLNSSYSGFQGPSMRGFSNQDTLVLLNGKRLTKYPIGGDSVDVNNIPMAVIQRVEVLRDGASAIYGSDAVAGVINIITKKDYQGVEVSGTVGQSSRSDGARTRASVTGGFGDLAENRFNVMFTADAEKIKKIKNIDRELTKSADLRKYGYTDDRLPTSPYPNVYFLDTDVYAPISPCPAPFAPGGEDVEGLGSTVNKVCPFDPNAITLLQPEIKSKGFFASGTLAITDDIQWRNEYFYKSKESGNYLNPQPISNTVAANDPANPYGVDVIWLFRSVDPRLYRTNNIEVVSQRAVTELTGSTAGFEWSIDAGQSKSEYTGVGSGYFVNSKFVNALATDVINPFTGKLNPDDLVPLTATTTRKAETKVNFANAKLSGEAFDLPAGPALFALGAGYFKETFDSNPDPLQAAGLLRGDPRLAKTNYSRDNKAIFAEAILPVTKSLEAGFAVRRDDYSDFGSTTNPKASLRYTPTRNLLIRSSFGKGFRAPDIEALAATDLSGFPSARDYQGCALLGISRENCSSKQYFTLTKSNPNLKPEESESFTLGIVFEPTPGLSTSLDYNSTEKTGNIDSLDIQAILDNPNLPVAGYGTAADLVRRLPNGQIPPDSTNPVIISPTANLGDLNVKTYDFNVTWSGRVSGWKVGVENNVSYLASAKKNSLPGTELEEYAGTAGYSRVRNVFKVNAESGALSGTAYVRTIGSFKDVTAPSEIGPGTRVIPSWTTVDVTLGYSGLIGKNSKIDFGVKNLLDRMPPLAEARNTSNKIDFAHSAVGRYYQLTGTFGF